MKLAILGDCHFGMRGDSVIFHKHYEKFYDEIFFPYLKENNIDTIFQMGDLFDRRKFINFNTLHLCRKYFFDKLKENNITFYSILGNHDISYRNTLEVNSSKLLLNEYDNITIYDEFITKEFDGVPIDIVPWLCKENEEQIMEQIKDSKSQICFGHFEIQGFEMDKGNVSQTGIDKKPLTKYDMVLTGHFHHKSNDGHVYYVGTPGQMTWADWNDPRGFHIFDTHTRELEFIKNPFEIFHKINYDDNDLSLNDIQNMDFDKYKDNYVKVVVLHKQNPYLFDHLTDNLYKVGAADISIVEDFSENNLESDEEIINQAEDTMTILSKYIDGLTLEVDNEKLKDIMRELYTEALHTEETD